MQNLDGSSVCSPVRLVTFNQETSLSIFPNPADNLVKLTWNTDELETKRDIQLFDSTGRLILAKTIENNTTSIDLSSVAAGIYWIHCKTGREISSHRLIRL